MNKQKFSMGDITQTKGAAYKMEARFASPQTLLMRHVTGDWGDISEDTKLMNDEAIANRVEGQLLSTSLHSSYKLDDDCTIWIITQHDESYTTVLLPDEY